MFAIIKRFSIILHFSHFNNFRAKLLRKSK